MAMRCRLVLAFVVVSSCGCAAMADSPRSDGIVTFKLQADQRNAGHVGSVITAARGDKTVIVLTLSNVPPWVAGPVQLHTVVYAGSCARHEATPAYALN
jgi:hypothetical protein